MLEEVIEELLLLHNLQKIVELETVKQLVDNGSIVITVGGGGIPVIENEDGSLTGVAAVIDKDKSSAKLAKDLDAEMLVNTYCC